MPVGCGVNLARAMPSQIKPEAGTADLTAQTAAGPIRPLVLVVMILAGAVILFAAACVRHFAFRSGAMDLGFFDQGIYLLSIGKPPIPSFQLYGFHILGDHAAFVLYPLSLLYRIYPSVLWLLGVQGLALALGCWPVYKLAMHEGLTHRQSLAMSLVYLLYPLVLTATLFDFHGDTLALPAFIAAVYFARAHKPVGFIVSCLFILACKELLGLFVAAMGAWLLVCERRRFYGAAAFVLGLTWFFVATKLVIPYFGSGRIAGLNYFAQFGGTMPEILKNMLLRPGLTLSIVFSLATLKYLAIEFVPVIWGLHYRTLWPLLAAVPVLALNTLASNENMRSPAYYYSLPVIPFLMLSLVLAVASRRAWLLSPRAIAIWSCGLIVLGASARLAKAHLNYAVSSSSGANREAIALLKDDPRPLLTTFENAPHLSHREVIQFFSWGVNPPCDLSHFDLVLMNMSQQTLSADAQTKDHADELLANLGHSPQFKSVFARDSVYVFERVARRAIGAR